MNKELEEVTRLLCAACTAMSLVEMRKVPGLYEWFVQHLKDYERRQR